VGGDGGDGSVRARVSVPAQPDRQAWLWKEIQKLEVLKTELDGLLSEQGNAEPTNA
jgi:hypothetical protein